MTPARMKELYDMGDRAARALKIGDVFTGAYGAAHADGITDTKERSLYAFGYLDALGERIRAIGVETDAAGRIINFHRLPKFCAASHPTTGQPIMIKRSERGYWPLEGISVEQFNARRNVTPAQREAMLAGSMFGWDCPAADPDNYDNTGVLKDRKP